jgi:acyl carrier protein
MAVGATNLIRKFIQEEILFDKDAALADDTALLSMILDSLGLVQLIGFIEKEFDIEVDDGDMTATNFGTIADINRFVQQKRHERA